MSENTLKTLYHGSFEVVRQPIYGFGRDNNDYGRGFYCTEDIELAREWSCSDMKSPAWVNEYRINTDGMSILNLDAPDYNEMNWLALLMNNRKANLGSREMRERADWIVDRFSVDVSAYDAIEGYRADDSFFGIVRAFVNNEIPLERLSTSLRRGDLGIQFFLQSRKAFDAINFVKAKPVDASVYYPRRVSRSMSATEEFKADRGSALGDGTYINDIIRMEARHESL